MDRTTKSLEKYRRAAQAVRSRKKHVTAPDVARELGFKQQSLDALTAEWRGYVGVVAHSAAVRESYLSAADTLRGLKKPRTIANIARILGRAFETVREYIETHPDVASYCEVEARYGVLERQYAEAAARLDAEGRKKTRKELAFELGLPYGTVSNLLSARPWLILRLGIVGRAPSGRSRRRRRRKARNKKSS